MTTKARLSAKQPMLCRIWGHKLNESAARYYNYYHCERCMADTDDVGLVGWLRLRVAYIRRDTRDAWCRFRSWLTCRDCGKHFGKHDETQDHIPF